eukprot:45126-Eustigmatos_ZCMA.PRE.1
MYDPFWQRLYNLTTGERCGELMDVRDVHWVLLQLLACKGHKFGFEDLALVRRLVEQVEKRLVSKPIFSYQEYPRYREGGQRLVRQRFVDVHAPVFPCRFPTASQVAQP